MENNSSLVLKITNIIWSQSSDHKEQLPQELKLQWDNKEWNYDQVSNWLSSYFNATIDKFDIKELENQKGGG